MEHANLGRTGLMVSELCLGAMYFGGETDEPTARRILDTFVEAGGNFIDTADCYQAGRSEEVLGRWLGNVDRESVVVATKVFVPTGPGPNDRGLSRKHILAGVEASLRRLDTEYIDLFYTHVYDDVVPLEETLSALDVLVTSGKVRYLGASNITAWQLQKAVDISERNGWARYVALQPLYNLLDIETEWELLPMAREAGIGVMPFSPLRAGWLGGRFTREMTAPPEGSRIEAATEGGSPERWENYATERTWQVLDVLREVAAETERTVAQVAIRWLMQSDGVTAPIVGPRSMRHLEGSLGAVGWTLSDEQFTRLRAAADKPKGYPYSTLDRFTRR